MIETKELKSIDMAQRVETGNEKDRYTGTKRGVCTQMTGRGLPKGDPGPSMTAMRGRYLAFDDNSKVDNHGLGCSFHHVDYTAGCKAATNIHVHLEISLSPVLQIKHPNLPFERCLADNMSELRLHKIRE